MRIHKLLLPLLLVPAIAGCGSQKDLAACDAFVPSFASLTIVVAESDGSTSSLGELKAAVDASVTEAEIARASAVDADLQEKLDSYVANRRLTSTALAGLMEGTLPDDLTTPMANIGFDGEWIINYCGKDSTP